MINKNREPSKTILHSADARQKLLEGVQTLASVVAATMGPKGRNVVIERTAGEFSMTKDGVTVASSIYLDDPLKNAGAQLVRQAAQKTADEAGDGTTTSTVLAQSLFSEGLALLEDGYNPVEINTQINTSVKKVIENLDKFTIDIKDENQIYQVALISANGDEKVANLVKDAFVAVSKDGAVTVDASNNVDSTLELTKGLRIGPNAGLISPYFINNFTKSTCELKEPKVLVVDGPVDKLDHILEVLEKCVENKNPLVIIGEEFNEDLTRMFIANREKDIWIVPLVAPHLGTKRQELLKDIAAVANTECFGGLSKKTIGSAVYEDLGTLDSIVLGKEYTTFVSAEDATESIKSRIEILTNTIDDTTPKEDKKDLNLRISKLKGGAAVIKVGGESRVEVQERKDRVDDAVAATQAALEEGIVWGGGHSYLHAIKYLDVPTFFKNALTMPCIFILLNAGEDAVHIEDILSTISKSKDGFGYNVLHKTYVDNLTESGIINPVKVDKRALINAASVATMLLTTEALIVNSRKVDD